MLKTFFTTILLLFIQIYTVDKKILEGKVIHIADGDTLTILDNENNQTKIRLHGIDCPEKGQDFFKVAKDFTHTQTMGKFIKVKVKNKDRYKRTVGEVMIGNSTNLNIKLLEKGLAWHYTSFDKSEKYAQAELSAKKNKMNIWSMNSPTPPWEYRKNKRKKI